MVGFEQLASDYNFAEGLPHRAAAAAAVTTAKRLPQLPDVPAIARIQLPGRSHRLGRRAGAQGYARAHRRLPEPQRIGAILESPAMQSYLRERGAEPMAMTPGGGEEHRGAPSSMARSPNGARR